MTRPWRLQRRAQRILGDADERVAGEREFSAWIRRTTGAGSGASVPNLVWPVSGRITSRFGDRLGRMHTGIDIAGPARTTVRAVAAGRVVRAGWVPELGNTVVLDHGGGFSTVFGHLDECVVRAGQTVTRAQPIGLLGATGRATGPHLHFETRVEGTALDPSSFLPRDGDPAEALRHVITRCVGDALSGVREVVLVGSALHANAGDALVWLGQIALLGTLGIRVRSVVHPASFDREPFDRSPSDAVVLLSGGGNFGDVWPLHQRHREWIFQHITNRRIVQLPQSLHFVEHENIRRAQRLVEPRDDVHLLWRDEHSLRIAHELFPTTASELAPDVAFARRPPRSRRREEAAVVWIARNDREGSSLRASRGTRGAVDWHVERHIASVARDVLWLLARVERRVPSPFGPRARLVLQNRSALLTAVAAANLVGNARVVVSDRLHAHVLCTMLAVPHVMVDDGYGKIRAFLEAWPVTCRYAQLASSPEDAARRAEQLLEEGIRERG